MKRYFSLALLATLLLSFVACPAIAEISGISVDQLEEQVSETDLTVNPDLAQLLINDEASAIPNATSSKKATSIRLSASSISIGENEEYTGLTVNPLPKGSAMPSIRWRSSNKKVAKVRLRNGKITGIKSGTCTIYARIKGSDKEVKCKVTVLKEPKKNKFSVSPKSGSLSVGETGQYKVKFDKGYGGSYTFKSSDNSIATIDESGVVTAVGVGKCNITVTTYNGVKRSVKLQVVKRSSTNSKIQKVLAAAEKKLDCPYKHGSNGPSKFDCVGFTYWCYKQVDVKLKDTPAKQANDSRFKKVSYSELQPGDLLYFHTDDSSKISHAALYIGNGELIHASYTAKKVIKSKMVTSKSNYYKRNFAWGRRVFS